MLSYSCSGFWITMRLLKGWVCLAPHSTATTCATARSRSSTRSTPHHLGNSSAPSSWVCAHAASEPGTSTCGLLESLYAFMSVSQLTPCLDCRGNSKYHYYGIRVKPDSPLNRLQEDMQYMALRQQPVHQKQRYAPLLMLSINSSLNYDFNCSNVMRFLQVQVCAEGGQLFRWQLPEQRASPSQCRRADGPRAEPAPPAVPG